MKILLTGGTGFIGRSLRKELVALGHKLIILTRANKENNESTNYIYWNWKKPTDLTDLMNEVDIVINLAGESIAKKQWTREQKDLIYKSRVVTTKLLVEAINKATKKPKKLITSSATGFYGNRNDEKIIETSSSGTGFLADTCKDWETEAQKATTNTVILRIGIVLGKKGGALEKMLTPFKMFIGGPLGSGKQWMSWVSIYDVTGLIKFAIENDNVTGILNATSPNPTTNKEFSNTLGKVLHRPSFMAVPGFTLKLLLGEMSDLLLDSQKVFPERVLQLGYKFKYPDLENALKRILHN